LLTRQSSSKGWPYTRGMGKHRAALVLILLLLAVLSGWWLLEVHYASGPMPALNTHTPIVVHHSQSGGLHTYTGSVPLSSACVVLSTGIETAGQNPAYITLMLSATMDTACRALAVPPQGLFTVSYEAPGTSTDVIFNDVRVDGTSAPYTLVED
jgi:hypothetical protein